MNSTLFLLAAQFGGRGAVTVEEVGAAYLGLSPELSRRHASSGAFPMPCFRMCDSQKSPWLVRLDDLAAHLDARRDEAAQRCGAVREL